MFTCVFCMPMIVNLSLSKFNLDNMSCTYYTLDYDYMDTRFCYTNTCNMDVLIIKLNLYIYIIFLSITMIEMKRMTI